ncbi:uncharacterized protein LOC136032276 isoform X2 [Artemia franciscana]|uniref:Uncharacterized protein n=2 Tax=Artemia franciscana TaxID=6661 RepID=A0AA88IBN4_ARTSF|nr:hypothetical protein QYM36_000007 [Artemia franciscana]
MDFMTARNCSFEELKAALSFLDAWKDLRFVNLAQPNISRNVLLVRIIEKLPTDDELTLACEDENSIPCKIVFERTLETKKLFHFLTKYIRKKNLLAVYGACKVKSQPTISISLDASLDSAKVLLFSKYDKISKLICKSIKKFSNSYEKEGVSSEVELVSVTRCEKEARLPTNQGDRPSHMRTNREECCPPDFEGRGIGYPKSRSQGDIKTSYIYSKLADIRLADSNHLSSPVNFFAVVIDGEVSNSDMDECQSILKIGDDSDYDQSLPFFLDYKSGNFAELVRITKGDVIRVHRAAVNFAPSGTYLKCWSGRSLMRLYPNHKFESTAKNPTLPTPKDWSRVDALTKWYKTQKHDEFRVPMPLSRRKLFNKDQIVESPPSPIQEIIPVRASPVKLSEIHLLGTYTVKATVQKIDEMRKLIVISDGTICPLIQSDPPRLGSESMDSIRVLCSADVFKNEKLVVGAHVLVTFNATKKHRVTVFHLVGPCEVVEVEVKESPATAVDSCFGQSLNLSGIFEVTRSQELRNSAIAESDKFDHLDQRDMHKNSETCDVITHENSILPNTEEMNVDDNVGDRILCPNSPQKGGGDTHDNVTAPNPQPRRSLRVAVPRLDMTALKRSRKRNPTIAVDRELKDGSKTRHHVIASTSHDVQKKEESLQHDTYPKAGSPQSHVSESIFSSGPSENLANFDSHPVPAFDYQSHDNVNLDYESHDITRKLRGKKRSSPIPRSLHRKKTSTPTRRKQINNGASTLKATRLDVGLPDLEEEDEAQDVSAPLPKPLVEINKCNRLWESSSTSDSDDEEMELIQVELMEIASRLKKKDKKKKKIDCFKEAMALLKRNDKTPKPKLKRALRLLIEGKTAKGGSDASFKTALTSP